ncbi:transcription elongation factor S-II (TFIIS) [Aphelenchoides avenae]|nr:transcription elongation factor S-II (TFIIS) [Aphelenchus avenae]
MSSCEEEVLRIAKKLDKMIEGKKPMDSALEYLEALAKLPMNIEILQKTRIGLKINDLRKKSNDDKLSKRAKSLIKEWKSLLESGQKASTPKPETNGTVKNGSPAPSAGSEDGSNTSNSQLSAPRSQPANNYSRPIAASGDEVRMKSVELLVNAFRSSELPDGTHDPDDVGVKVEEQLFTFHKGTTDKYKSAVRSRIFNLRKNQALRENLLTGAISAEKFATMTSDEMASDDMKKLRETFTKEAIRDHQMAIAEGTPSEMFKCGKCGKKNCTYTQVQTRSADEPMTTFVYCRDCGNRWKFC